jgi:nicotinamidase/pyrazinamidase
MVRYRPDVALIVVDVQNDFADPRGSLSVAGGSDVIPIINREVAQAREAGALVVYSQDWHPETTPHFQKDGGIWPVHCVQESWGAAFHPDLDVPEGAPVVHKGNNREDGYSAFTCRDHHTGELIRTELESILKRSRIHDVVIVGLATDYCVKSTALDAVMLGFPATVLTNAVAAVDLQPGDGTRALEEVEAAGVSLDATTAAA